jgi:LmbE family N-acetylglucosaminyl deacetylase
MRWLARVPASVFGAVRRFLSNRWFRPTAIALLLIVGVAYTYLQAPVLWFVHLEPPLITAPASASGERLLIIAPHPDDDVLAVGGEMAVAASRGDSVLVVYLTSGDANIAGKRLITMTPFLSARSFRALGERRQKEAVLALGRLGIAATSAVFLNYPDQGLMDLVIRNWSTETPYRSRFTKRDAKYSDDAFHPGSTYCGENVLADLVEIVETYRPTVIYVPHPSDRHPDHSAGYFLAALAVQKALAVDSGAAPHEVLCYLTHSRDHPWPAPRGIGPKREFDFPPALLNLDAWTSVQLPPWSVRKKLDAIEGHLSQWWTSGQTMESYARSNEVFMVVSIEPFAAVPHWPTALAPGNL